MAMSKTELVGAYGNNLRFGKAWNFVKIAFYNMYIAANATKELEGLLTAEITSAQNVLDLSWG
jgi:hypothetical protein